MRNSFKLTLAVLSLLVIMGCWGCAHGHYPNTYNSKAVGWVK